MRRLYRPAARESGRPFPEEALARADQDLLAEVEASLQEAARKAGSRLACRPGCSECCILGLGEP